METGSAVRRTSQAASNPTQLSIRALGSRRNLQRLRIGLNKTGADAGLELDRGAFMKPRRLALILILGFFTSFVFGMLRGGTTLATYDWGPDAPVFSTDPSQKRSIETPRWTLAAHLGAAAAETGTSSLLRRGPSGSLLVANFRTGEVHQLDLTTGESIVRARSAPPPSDFGFDQAGKLWWIPSSTSQIERQLAPEKESRPLRLENPPHRLAIADDGRFTAMEADSHRTLFRSYSPDGRGGPAFGRFLAGDNQELLVLEGHLAALESGGFVYAPHYLPFLASFSFDGTLRFARPLVGAQLIEVPRIVRGARDSRNLEPGTRVNSLSVHETRGRIAILSELWEARQRKRVLDLYRSSDGEYLRSLELPDGTRDALLLDEELFTLHRDGIRRWLNADAEEAPEAAG